MKKISGRWILVIIFLATYFLGFLGSFLYHYFQRDLSYRNVGDSLFFFVGPLVAAGSVLFLKVPPRYGFLKSPEARNPVRFKESSLEEKPTRAVVYTLVGAGVLLAITGYVLTWVPYIR